MNTEFDAAYTERINRYSVLPHWLKENLAIAELITNKSKGGRNLDVGCGNGKLCWMISKFGGDSVGVDVSETNLERATDLYPSLKGKFFLYDGYDLPWNDNAFKTATCCYVLSHVQCYPKLLCDIKRVLVPEGEATFVVINWWYYVLAWLPNLLKGYKYDKTIKWRWSKRRFLKDLEKVGFEIVYYQKWGFKCPIAPWVQAYHFVTVRKP